MQDSFLTKAIIVLLAVFSGFLIAVFLTQYLNITNIRILFAPGVLLLAVTLYTVIRRIIVNQRKALKSEVEKQNKTEVGFVVDTFQELVRKLKDKEKELEKLRALAEDRAVRIEAYNENVLQSVQSGVVSIDNSLKIKSVNQSAEKTLGIKAEEVLDKECSEIFSEPLLEILKFNKSLTRGEYPYVTKDKRNVWLGINTSQLKNAAGEVIGFILVFTDLTNVKALQMRVELKERLTQLGEMSAGIAHELRNPMSVIAGYAKLLNKRVDSSEMDTVNAIIKEIENMDSIISEFLAFAKPTDLNRGKINLQSLIQATYNTVVGDNHTINVSIIADKQLFVMGDDVLLRQAFTNLFTNAVEAMSEGGDLTVELDDFKDRIEIRVKDTGYGIPEDIKKRIFLPFYTTKEKGIGLGLAIVQKIIVSHGGSIEIDSNENKGTTFSITLPAFS
jgi:PAS domain S-box-containing protein